MKTNAKRIAIGFLFLFIFPLYGAAQTVEITITITIERLAAVLVTAPGDKAGDPGETLTFSFMVQNVGNVSDIYDLSATSTNGWVTNLPAGDTLGPLASKETPAVVIVELTLPAGAEPGTDAILTLTVTSQHDPDTSQSAGATATIGKSPKNPSGLAPVLNLLLL